MEILKVSLFILLQISLIVLAQNVTSSEKKQGKISTREINDATQVSNVIRKMSENSTAIESVDNSTETETVVANDTTTTPLIPIATVEAQIEMLDVTSKKPSRVQIVAAQ